MKFRDDWLSLTPERAIDPDLQICDAHQHLVPDRYEVKDFLHDINGGHNVVKTVLSGSEPSYQLIRDNDGEYHLVKTVLSGDDKLYEMFSSEEITEETKYVMAERNKIKSKTDIAAGIVGYANLFLGKEVASDLESQIISSDDRFRGVRIITCWDQSPLFHHPPTTKDMMYDSKFREGIITLHKYNLTFDAWVYFHQLLDLVDLAKATPETIIILDHIGGPLGIGPYAQKREWVLQEWKRGITALAVCPNVYVKLGGLGSESRGFGWREQAKPPSSAEMAKIIAPYYLFCIEKFGVDRCMFESNYPEEKMSCSYTVLWNAYKLITNNFSQHERRALLHDNAVKVYRL